VGDAVGVAEAAGAAVSIAEEAVALNAGVGVSVSLAALVGGIGGEVPGALQPSKNVA